MSNILDVSAVELLKAALQQVTKEVSELYKVRDSLVEKQAQMECVSRSAGKHDANRLLVTPDVTKKNTSCMHFFYCK